MSLTEYLMRMGVYRTSVPAANPLPAKLSLFHDDHPLQHPLPQIQNLAVSHLYQQSITYESVVLFGSSTLWLTLVRTATPFLPPLSIGRRTRHTIPVRCPSPRPRQLTAWGTGRLARPKFWRDRGGGPQNGNGGQYRALAHQPHLRRIRNNAHRKRSPSVLACLQSGGRFGGMELRRGGYRGGSTDSSSRPYRALLATTISPS